MFPSSRPRNVDPSARRQERSRRFVVVYHSDDDFDSVKARVDQLHASGQIEYGIVGHETGRFGVTNHYHLYLVTPKRHRFDTARTDIQNLFPAAHVETAYANDKRNREYAMKERDHYEVGTPPDEAADARHEDAMKDRTDKHTQALELAREGRMNEIEPGMLLRYWRTFKDISDKAGRVSEPLPHQAGLWFWGPRGTWKTMSVVQALGGESNFYTKTQDQWWDNYDNQPYVVIDDLDLGLAKQRNSPIPTLLKTWGGNMPFSAPNKGGSLGLIRPAVIIITSNWSPEQAWGTTEVDKTVHLEPILKRYTTVFVDKPGALTPDNVIQYLYNLTPVVEGEKPSLELPPHMEARKGKRALSITASPIDHVASRPTAQAVILKDGEGRAVRNRTEGQDPGLASRVAKQAATEHFRRQLAVREFEALCKFGPSDYLRRITRAFDEWLTVTRREHKILVHVTSRLRRQEALAEKCASMVSQLTDTSSPFLEKVAHIRAREQRDWDALMRRVHRAINKKTSERPTNKPGTREAPIDVDAEDARNEVTATTVKEEQEENMEQPRRRTRVEN